MKHSLHLKIRAQQEYGKLISGSELLKRHESLQKKGAQFSQTSMKKNIVKRTIRF